MPSWDLTPQPPAPQALTAPSQSSGPSQTLENSCLHGVVTLFAHRGGLRARFARKLSFSASKGTAGRLHLCPLRVGIHIHPNAHPRPVQSQALAARSLNWILLEAPNSICSLCEKSLRNHMKPMCLLPRVYSPEARSGHEPGAAVREEVSFCVGNLQACLLVRGLDPTSNS